jgi:chlorite dismutase
MIPKGVLDRQAGGGDEILDISERGRNAEGEEIRSDRRLFVQMLAFGDCTDTEILVKALSDANLPGALYLDLNDPRGVGLLIYSEDPSFFVDQLRQFLLQSPFSDLTPKLEYTMFGRTYSIGYEADLDATLVERPRGRITDPSIPWAIWYPLRRSGSFEQLSAEDQRKALMEHGGIGRAYGRAGLGTDIRLACHGLTKDDNDFVIALIGNELYPLSSIVQRMRKTVQTSEHMEKMGPFFVGKAIWQNEVK